jgi:Protein of unknown function (DUF2848)
MCQSEVMVIFSSSAFQEADMAAHSIEFTIHANNGTTAERLAVTQLVIAGWTGRDPVARDRHIAELEALGIARPATTPIYYPLAASRLTTATVLEASGADSSGEVEFVLLRAGGRLLVGVGSDHTDRKAETYSVTLSKQLCDHPVAPELWAFEDVAGHWDEIILRSYATIGGARVLYQEGTLAAMLPPGDLIAAGFGTELPDGAAMFGGTFAAKGGIRPAERFDFEIVDPVLGRSIRHGYAIVTLPVRG